MNSFPKQLGSLRVLLTNDDGIDAPGLKVLRRIAAEFTDDIWVCAPGSESYQMFDDALTSNRVSFDLTAIQACQSDGRAWWADATFGSTDNLPDPNGDIDGNGRVDFADFLVLSNTFGQSTRGAVQAVPEPSAAVLLVLALGLWMTRSRRH